MDLSKLWPLSMELWFAPEVCCLFSTSLVKLLDSGSCFDVEGDDPF